MPVRILFFAGLRQAAGSHDAEVAVTPGETFAKLWERLERQSPSLAPHRDTTRVARNGALVSDWKQPVNDGDEVAFLPPSSGG